MKCLYSIFICTFCFCAAKAQNSNPNYDADLAQKAGADDYGMKKYVLVILKTGSNLTTDKKFIDSCFQAHMANIGRMADEGKLVVAGPMAENDHQYEGIFILNAADMDEAHKLLQHDAAVNEHLLEAELFTWYGSAALPFYLDEHDKIWKVGF